VTIGVKVRGSRGRHHRRIEVLALQACAPAGATRHHPPGWAECGRGPGSPINPPQHQEILMSNHIYKMIELVGSSTTTIDDAVQNAIAKAAKTMRNIHWFQVTETRGTVVGDKIGQWQVTLKIGFTLEE
jgi:flavin-binding protein dodecin